MIILLLIIVACAISFGSAWHLGFNAGRDRLYRELDSMSRHPSTYRKHLTND